MSGEFIRGRPRGIKSLVEDPIIASGMFKLIHDGSPGNVNQVTHTIGDSSFYTKVYRLFLTSLEEPKGEFLNTWVRLRYDFRNNWADVTISHRNLMELERVWEEQCQKPVMVDIPTE